MAISTKLDEGLEKYSCCLILRKFHDNPLIDQKVHAQFKPICDSNNILISLEPSGKFSNSNAKNRIQI